MFSRNKLRQLLTNYQRESKKLKFEQYQKQDASNRIRSACDNIGISYYGHNDENNHIITNNGSGRDDKDDEIVCNRNDVDEAGGIKILTQYFSNAQLDINSVKTIEQQNNGNNNNNKHNQYNDSMDTFHRAICPILLLGQCFALMPVIGIIYNNPRRVRFSYKSPAMVVTLLFFAANTTLTWNIIRDLLNVGVNPKNIVGAAFFLCVHFICFLFLSLARRWPHLIRYWSRIELIFTRKPYMMPKQRLATRIQMTAIVIILLSIVEHAFFLTSSVLSYVRKTRICTSHEISFEDFMCKNYIYIFQVIPYSTVLAITVLITNGACTFIWNYMDLFIIIISKGISYRFEQITERVRLLADKEVPESVFIEIREHYVKLCELLDKVDENLSGIILLSSTNNLYFVCNQLLNIFNKFHWPINYIYYWFSLAYLIGRTAFVFLAAATINDESKNALNILRRVSSKTWCVEVERLIFQMATQTVALSGKKFYFLTRRLLFGMAGTIVTYELVLLQFDAPSRAKGLPALCS